MFSYRQHDVYRCSKYPNEPTEAHLQVLEIKT